MEQGGHAGEDVAAAEEGLAVLHKGGDGVCAIADALLQLGRDERDGLGLVEAQAPGQPLLGEKAGLGKSRVRTWARIPRGRRGYLMEEKLVLLPGRDAHCWACAAVEMESCWPQEASRGERGRLGQPMAVAVGAHDKKISLD